MPKSEVARYYSGGSTDQWDLLNLLKRKGNKTSTPKDKITFLNLRRKSVAVFAASTLGVAGVFGIGIKFMHSLDRPDNSEEQITTPIMQAESPPKTPPITPAIVKAMIPDAPEENIDKYYPLIIDAMNEQGLNDRLILVYAVATIGVETANTFAPIEEFNGRTQAKRFGYKGGEEFYGRGFIQLTHDTNYREIGQMLGMSDELVKHPQIALDPIISSKILASYLKKHEDELRDALSRLDLRAARAVVNGGTGTNGLDQFSAAYKNGLILSVDN